MKEYKSYLGTGWKFPPTFIKDSGVVMVSDEEDIRESLRILLSTVPGERIFRFKYGCGISKWVFSEMNLSEKTLLTDTIEQAIILFEPRIRLDKIDVEIKDELEGILWINIDYTIEMTNTRSNMVFPFYFIEGTNL